MQTQLRAPSVARPSARRTRFLRRNDTVRYLFVLPAVLFLVAFFIYPMLYNINLSFQHVDITCYLQSSCPYNGIHNYQNVLGNDEFRQAAKNTAIFTVASLVGQFIFGLALALFFNRAFPLARGIRALILLPWLLPLVVTAAVFQWVFTDPGGLMNHLLVDIFPILRHQQTWLEDPGLAMLVAIVTNVWVGIPFNMIILHSGLQGIPAEIYEAAEIDGAGRISRFWQITLPLLRPVIAVLLILGFIYTLKVFDVVYVLTGGGPNDSTELLSVLSYKIGFGQGLFGRAAAIGNIMVVVALVCGLGYVLAVRREGEWS